MHNHPGPVHLTTTNPQNICERVITNAHFKVAVRNFYVCITTMIQLIVTTNIRVWGNYLLA